MIVFFLPPYIHIESPIPALLTTVTCKFFFFFSFFLFLPCSLFRIPFPPPLPPTQHDPCHHHHNRGLAGLAWLIALIQNNTYLPSSLSPPQINYLPHPANTPPHNQPNSTTRTTEANFYCNLLHSIRCGCIHNLGW